MYNKFIFVHKNVLLQLFRLHAMSFYGAETWSKKLNKKELKNISVPYHKAIKRVSERYSHDSSHVCLDQVN